MKHLRSIALIAFMSLLTFCTYQRSEKNRDKVYTNAELIGKWNQVDTEKSQSDTDPAIEYIQLVNDSIAQLRIIDSKGRREISGKWSNSQFEKNTKILGLKFESDICITYFVDDYHYMQLFELRENNEKLIMTNPSYQFEKE